MSILTNFSLSIDDRILRVVFLIVVPISWTIVNSGALFNDRKNNETPSLESRISSLTGSLNQAASAISDIEDEVMRRRELVERLKEDAQVAQSLINLNAPQAEAVAQLLRREIDRDQDRAFWIDTAQNFGFTVFGFALSEGMAWFRRRRRKTLQAQSE